MFRLPQKNYLLDEKYLPDEAYSPKENYVLKKIQTYQTLLQQTERDIKANQVELPSDTVTLAYIAQWKLTLQCDLINSQNSKKGNPEYKMDVSTCLQVLGEDLGKRIVNLAALEIRQQEYIGKITELKCELKEIAEIDAVKILKAEIEKLKEAKLNAQRKLAKMKNTR